MADRPTRTKRWPVTGEDVARAMMAASPHAYVDDTSKRTARIDGTFDLDHVARILNIGTM